MSIAVQINKIKDAIPKNIKLIAVSKTISEALMMEAYDAGHKIFGENKAQELASKYTKLPKDIEWHMVGHLQTNKVKYIAAFVNLIHSVDSINLLQTIDKEGSKHCRVIHCLMQVKIAKEDTKFGLTPGEIEGILNSIEFKEMKNIRIIGLMGIATFTDDYHTVRNEFKNCKIIFDNIRDRFFADDQGFKELSMGMSDDYKIAIEEGSTMVRIGSSIFGKRIYS
jgi:pyridoxal phosphate enzyme (YggS family)